MARQRITSLRMLATGAVLAAAAGCAATGGLPGLGGGATGGGGGFREYLVLGSAMSFEQCRSRGGFIIRDAGSPMVACDPRVIRAPVPADEFDHPGRPAAAQADQIAATVEG
ncbi:MAG: hypothetical protein ACU0BF_09275 [Paracoccaceae bacterium]